MTKRGPGIYPGAERGRHWYQDTYGGDAMESNVIVWHTTETDSLPGYGGGASAPNLTALPDIADRRVRWFQHFDFDVSSRALENDAGGVETNTLNACQVELVGTCDPAHRSTWDGRRAGRDYIYWPDAPDWALAELGKFVRWAYEEHGVQMRSDVDWTPYPESYGGGSYRLSGAEWLDTYGHVGHQHVPENDHGDPGDLNFARVLEHAEGTATERKDTDMPISDDDATKVARHTLKKDGILDHPVRWRKPGSTNQHIQLETAIHFIGDTALDAAEGVAALREQIERLSVGGVDLDALAAKVAPLLAEELSDRLAK